MQNKVSEIISVFVVCWKSKKKRRRIENITREKADKQK